MTSLKDLQNSEFNQQLISDEEFDNFLDDEMAYIKDYFDKPTDSYMANMKILCKEGVDEKFNLIAVMFADLPDTQEEKFKAMRSLGIKTWEDRKKNGMPLAVMFSSEAWVRQFTTEEEKKFRDTTKRVSDYDDKTEGIVCFGMTIDKRLSLATYTVKRNKKGLISKVNLNMYAPYRDKTASKVESDLVREFFVGCALAAIKD